MNNICPTCGTAYSVSSRDVGRRIACKKCRSQLLVTEVGLVLDPPSHDEMSTLGLGERPPPPRDERAPLRFTFDWPILLLGIGSFFVIYFLFAPLADRARVTARNADIEAGDLQFAEDLEIEKDATRKKKFEEDWQKEKKRLERRVQWAKASEGQAGVWNRNGTMFGFLFLAVGSLGLLSPKQPAIRRVVGAVLFLSMLISVFLIFAIAGGTAAALR